jgi:hypothetical protein
MMISLKNAEGALGDATELVIAALQPRLCAVSVLAFWFWGSSALCLGSILSLLLAGCAGLVGLVLSNAFFHLDAIRSCGL